MGYVFDAPVNISCPSGHGLRGYSEPTLALALHGFKLDIIGNAFLRLLGQITEQRVGFGVGEKIGKGVKPRRALLLTQIVKLLVRENRVARAIGDKPRSLAAFDNLAQQKALFFLRAVIMQKSLEQEHQDRGQNKRSPRGHHGRLVYIEHKRKADTADDIDNHQRQRDDDFTRAPLGGIRVFLTGRVAGVKFGMIKAHAG